MVTQMQTILIVDDTLANIEVLSEVLGTEHEILFAMNGPEALEIARNQLPDLILLDVMMPEMDGYEICSRLKADPQTETIPVIFVTARDQEADEANGLNRGAIDYLTKPIRTPIVKARVRNHLELKRYRDLLENLSATDGLTGIANRRRFDTFLKHEWQRAQRDRAPLSLILADLDFFKAYNDHYGHLAGDDCLRQIAQALVDSCRRPADLVARYGGEEFAGVLPNTDTEGALWVAHQLLDRLHTIRIPHASSPLAPYVTASLGVATVIPQPGQSSSDLIRCADKLLYQAKQEGRNQVRSYPSL